MEWPTWIASLQVERFDERREIVGVGVHLVAVPRLARAAVAAAVVRDAAVSAVGQKDHLVFPGVRAERPAVTEDDGLSRAPVLVINLRAVFGRDCGHGIFSFSDELIFAIRKGPLNDRERFRFECRFRGGCTAPRSRIDQRPESVSYDRREPAAVKPMLNRLPRRRRLVSKRIGEPPQQTNALPADLSIFERTQCRQFRRIHRIEGRRFILDDKNKIVFPAG